MTVVVDAAAVLALMLGESGGELVAGVIRGSVMSAVNASESCARAVERGATADDMLSLIRSFEVRIVPFDLDQALAAARLRVPTKSAGLGIGDRACLALAERLGGAIYTGDRRLAAAGEAIGFDIRLIR